VRDGDDKSPFGAITKWEDVEDVLELPKDRVGDLILSNNPGYGWTEDMTEDLSFFSVPLEGGYKQAIKKGFYQGSLDAISDYGTGSEEGPLPFGTDQAN
jgi:hypothetical protein